MVIHVKKVVTYLGEGVIQYAQGVPERNKIPAIVVGSPHLRPHERGFKYWFSAFGKTSDSARFICDVLDSVPPERRPKTFAIFQEQTEGFRKEVVRRGYKIVAFEKYTQLSKDFSPMIMAAKNAGAEAVLDNPGAPDGMAMMRQMKELDFSPKAVAFIRAAQDLSWGKAMGPMGDYVLLSTYWHHRVKYPGVDKLNAAHQAKFGRPTDVLAGPAYAAVQVLAAAIEKAGSLDPSKIRDAIAVTDMMTVEGNIKFRPDGTIFDPCPAVVQWQGGNQKLVWPQEFRETSFVYPTPSWRER